MVSIEPFQLREILCLLIMMELILSKVLLKKGKSYMFVTRDGIVYKRFGKLDNIDTFVSSDNALL
jgi:hypothetical protein